MFLLNLTVMQQADLGGRLVYLEGAGVKPAMEAMKESEHSHQGAEGGHDDTKSENVPSASPTASAFPSQQPMDDHSGHDHDH